MLVDAVRLSGEGESARGESRLRLASGDARGRDIFLREGAGGGKVLMEPALAEHLALSAICVMRPDMREGEIAFFSVISSFDLARELGAGEDVTAEVVRLRDKGRFRRFHGTVRGEDGSVAAEADIMAYTAAPAAAAEKRESGRLMAPPEIGETRPVDAAVFGWRRPEMVFVQDRVHVAPGMAQATMRYTYPPDHPFCAGHFPGNPVMMGVTQWMAALDAAAWLVFERSGAGAVPPGPGRWRGDVEILRGTGGIVAEIKGLVFSGDVSSGGVGPLRIEKTRRVGFRDQVRPGETIFVRARVEPL